MDKVGVDGAILVSPNSLYAYDASYAVDVQRAYPRRFAMVKPMNPHDPAADETVSEWKKTPGAVGIRVMFALTTTADLDSAAIDRILRAAALHDKPCTPQCRPYPAVVPGSFGWHPQSPRVVAPPGLC